MSRQAIRSNKIDVIVTCDHEAGVSNFKERA
jgi:hypothetical protein